MRLSSRRIASALVVAGAAGSLVLGSAAAPAWAVGSPNELAQRLVRDSTLDGANRHLIALQRIADRNGGTRYAGSPGYTASVDYVAAKLTAAGFSVETPSFTYNFQRTDAQKLTVAGTDYPVIRMTSSPNTPTGGVTAPLVVVPEDATTGCEIADFAGLDATGKIALIRRGGCSFAQKSQTAATAGALGAVISNNTSGDLNGTLGASPTGVIPTGGVTQAAGTTLAANAGASATLDLRVTVTPYTVKNVIAETTTGRKDNVVMAGAHLDSVVAGPGINDNGSGSAALLDVALALGGAPKTNNAIRFAWWAAEEAGLLGSTDYVSKLSFEQQLDIALYLNFDMVASPNPAYFVYDGDNSDNVGAEAGPYGSAQIESLFSTFLAQRKGVTTQGTDFDGRSDYGPFIANGIPAGGLFSGAEGIKTAAQADLWGGQAGVAYDRCYHQACDNLGNLDRTALNRNLDAIAWAIGSYGYSTQSVNGVRPAAKAGAQQSQRRSLAVKAARSKAASVSTHAGPFALR